MSVLKVRVQNMGKLQGKVKKLDTSIKRAVIQGLQQLAPQVQDYARGLILSGPKSGRIYTRYNPFRVHQASAPGQAPASDTGHLVSTIQAKVDPTQFNLSLSAGGAARELEYGTHKMAPRPFMRRTIMAFRKKIVTTIQKSIRGVL